MDINDLLKKENKELNEYYNKTYNTFDFSFKGLTSLNGLPEKFNYNINIVCNSITNFKGLPKKFNSEILISSTAYLTNCIQTLDGLNDILDPKNIKGLKWDFIVSEYRRLGKHHLLV